MDNAESVLTTIGLTKRFGGLVALNNVNIKVKRNSLTLLIGPNGAGKTTFINTCIGVLKPDKGKVIFSPDNGSSLDITGWPPHKVYKLGFVRSFQIPQPFLSLTVLENILTVFSSKGENPLYAPIRPVWRKVEEEYVEKAFKVLKLVGLDSYWDMPAYKLGAGQLKMLEVARALAANAKLVALDEPIGGTDPAYAKSIFEKLRAIKSSVDITFLVVEHRIDIALPFADYVYAMDRGSVIAEGSPWEISKNPKVVEVYIGE
ncbi:MAG: ABC transporter ATP-binding protein [Desulfurococcaceae archaeon]|jgi:branched-chain amino acid transport system ATP-binding protein|nr:ABC transporter ATP-binding protein [Desulfurococcaceae archaeon]